MRSGAGRAKLAEREVLRGGFDPPHSGRHWARLALEVFIHKGAVIGGEILSLIEKSVAIKDSILNIIVPL